GSGIATFAVSANTSSEPRSTTVLVAGQSVVVNQAGVGQTSQGDPAPPTLGEPEDTEVVFFHTDAIGSVRMVTDASGAVLHRYDYTPDGALLSESGSGVPWNRRSWAGKERDVETAAGATQPLDYFGARYYAQQLGRFTAVDPVLVIEEALGDPQRWNRYGYGLANPSSTSSQAMFRFGLWTRTSPACGEA
ncbi:MAG: RHS repeat-associated core domain-containing protein, partial [Vicinamibacterales bacterium]|nr:RHS repeat-associated core domain-containing protein [Vicinamibacterales bacterium]